MRVVLRTRFLYGWRTPDKDEKGEMKQESVREREREMKKREESVSIHAIHKSEQTANNEKARYAHAHTERGKISERGNGL